MSDHSHDHEEQSNFISKLIGTIFLVAVPAALVVMLAVTGFAFVAGIHPPGKTDKPSTNPATNQTAAPATQGGTSAPVEATTLAPDLAQMDIGQKAFMNCMACHGPDGKGMKVGPSMMAPSLSGSELLLGDPEVALLIVLKGIQKEGANFMGVMMPLAAALDDEKLAAVLTYSRNSFGNSAPAVTVEQAAAARAKFATIDAPAGIKRAEIVSTADAHK